MAGIAQIPVSGILPRARLNPIGRCMTDDNKKMLFAAGAAIGSAAVAAAMLYANKANKRKRQAKPTQLPPIPSGENPETD